MKKYLLFLLISVIFFFTGSRVFAYDLTLTSVGSLSTLGTNYSLVNYTGGVPTLTGTASPSAQVGVKIKTFLSYTTASSSGIWQYIPAALDRGDNLIVLSSGIQSISFTLRFNATASATLSATPAVVADEAELLESGVWEYYLLVVVIGIGVMFFGTYVKQRMHKWEKGD